MTPTDLKPSCQQGCIAFRDSKGREVFSLFQAFLVAQRLKRLPAMRETRVWSLGWEDPLEKEMATHSSILAWRIPWMGEPGRLQSTGSQRVGHDWATSLTHFGLLEAAHNLWIPATSQSQQEWAEFFLHYTTLTSSASLFYISGSLWLPWAYPDDSG